MELKVETVNGTDYAVMSEGKPVYVSDDGTEISADYPHADATIRRLNGEAKAHREAKESAEKALKAYEGLDPDEARKAIDAVSGLDEAKQQDAAEAEKSRKAAIEAALAPVEKERDEALKSAEALQNQLEAEVIGGAFSRSKFISEKMATTPWVARKAFSEHFKVENGQPRAYDANGNLIYSRQSPGEPADFDDAMEQIVNNHSERIHLLKGSGKSGIGVNPGNGGAQKKQFSDMSGQELVELRRTNPQEYDRLKAAG